MINHRCEKIRFCHGAVTILPNLCIISCCFFLSFHIRLFLGLFFICISFVLNFLHPSLNICICIIYFAACRSPHSKRYQKTDNKPDQTSCKCTDYPSQKNTANDVSRCFRFFLWFQRIDLPQNTTVNLTCFPICFCIIVQTHLLFHPTVINWIHCLLLCAGCLITSCVFQMISSHVNISDILGAVYSPSAKSSDTSSAWCSIFKAR